jgi:hypothetical protein
MRHLPLCVLLLVYALSPLPRATPGEQEEHDEHETELAGRMERIEDALKELRKHLKEESGYPAALAALAEIQGQALACKLLVPAAAAQVPEGERAAFVTSFRRTMVDFLLRQLELEAALLDGDAAAVKAAFERLRDMEDSAHERFAPEEADEH